MVAALIIVLIIVTAAAYAYDRWLRWDDWNGVRSVQEIPFLDGLIVSVRAPDMWFDNRRWKCQLVRFQTVVGIEYRLDIDTDAETTDEWFSHQEVLDATNGDLVQYMKRLYKGREWY